MNEKPKLIVICGPTGIGKTSLAITLAKAAGGEIIGADSMQIYRYMDIGTAKPTPGEQQLVRHHMIDIADPDAPFDAAKYAEFADNIITTLNSQGTTPVVAGGTGLYIKALAHGLFRNRPADPAVIAGLEAEMADSDSHTLHQRLDRVDSAAAGRIHPNDGFRIIRALEVHASTGKTMTEFQAEHAFSENKYNLFQIGLTMDREKLYERINQRVDLMIDQGFVDEVAGLIAKGYPTSLKTMQSLGYRHIGEYLENRLSWNEALRTLKRDTRRYAKRQLTWFTKQPGIHWVCPEDGPRLIETALHWLSV